MADREVKVAILGDAKQFSSAITEAETALGAFGEKLAGFGKLAAVGFAAAGIGAVVGLEKIGESFDSAFDKIRIQTGATGPSLQGLQDSFKNVFANVPASMDTVSQAIGQVNTKLGLTGKPLEDVSTQFVNLSRLTKTDLGTNIESVTSLFNNFGIAAKDQGPKLDELFSISQKTGISVSDLATQMAGAGVQLRQSGLSFDESGALLGVLAKNGLSASDAVPALSKAMATAAKEGKPAQQVIADTFAAIKNAPTDTKAAGEALTVFGAKAGPKLAELIREGKLSYDDFLKAVQAGGDTINGAATATDDWREKLEIFKNKALVALEPVASAVFDGLTRGLDFVLQKINDWGPAVGDAFDTVRDIIIGAIDDIIAGFENPDAINGLKGWAGVAVTVGQDIRKAFDAVKDWFVANWPTIQAAFSKAWDIIKAGFQWLLDHKPVLIAAVVALAAVFVGPFVTAIAVAVIAYQKFAGFREVVDAVVSWIVNVAWPALKSGFDTVKTWVEEFAQGWSDRWADIKAAFETVITAIGLILAPTLILLQALWDGFHDHILGIVQAVWGIIAAIIGGFMQQIQGVIDIILGLLSGDWGRAWDGIKEFVNGVWIEISGIVTNAINLVVQIVQGALGTLESLWSTAWGVIEGALSTAWASITDAVSTGVATVVTFFAGLPASILAALSTLAGDLATLGTNALDALRDGALAALQDVITFFEGVPGAIVTAIGDVASTFADVGKKIIGGIVSGVESAAGAIKDAVTGAVKDAIASLAGPLAGPVKALFNLFADGGVVPGAPGQPVAAIVHGGETVLNSAQQANVLMAIAQGGGSGNGQTINLTVNATGDPQTVARTTAAELGWLLRVA